jgi:hypothetical protein
MGKPKAGFSNSFTRIANSALRAHDFMRLGEKEKQKYSPQKDDLTEEDREVRPAPAQRGQGIVIPLKQNRVRLLTRILHI